MESVQQKIAALLEQLIGLTVTSIGSSTFQRAVNRRKDFLGIKDDEAYLEKLTVSYMELRRLVEEVVVPETWFFRDQEPFTFLTEYVHNSSRDFNQGIFRILSLPCSTGEEPFSIAMTLLQAGLKPSSFFIDGVDVSSSSLETARLAIYRHNSFRTKDLNFRDLYFSKVDKGYSLKREVREKVRFVQGNILQPSFLDSLGRYDLVFCRNLLIYFNKETQEQAIDGLYKLLLPKGILFTGHSEASLFMGGKFQPVAHSRAFAFYKQEAVEEPSWRQKAKKLRAEKEVISDSPVARRQKRVPKLVGQRPDPNPKVKVESHDEFARVQSLADKGQLDEAARLCESHVKGSNPSAKWYYLYGVIRDSQGQTEEARKHFRKAVYLDPGNVESLVQLALLAEKAGNFDSAENYKRRVRMVQKKG